MQRNTIVYFGIIQREYNNAMCQHADGISMLIRANGYRAVTIGVSPNVVRGSIKRINEDTYAVNDPQSAIDRIKECVSYRDILRALKEIGLDNIKAFIMADFRYYPMKKLSSFCKKNGIHFAVDIMDFFVASEGMISKIKKIDCDMRMKHLYPSVARRIYICSAYNALLGEGEHTAVIPGVTWTKFLSEKPVENRKQIRLVFLGRPGAKCEKEKIDWVIRVLYENQLSDKFLLDLAGFDEKEFFDNNPEMKKLVTPNVVFHGRISHEECIELLKRSDFSVVIRPNTVLSQYGFSTKIGESFSCGVPVLATDTSDNAHYIYDGKNGFVCGCSYDEVCAMLKNVSTLSLENLYDMKGHIYSNNPLEYSRYTELFRQVVINA